MLSLWYLVILIPNQGTSLLKIKMIANREKAKTVADHRPLNIVRRTSRVLGSRFVVSGLKLVFLCFFWLASQKLRIVQVWYGTSLH